MKKVLLLAAAVLTLGTATAHLGLDGTFGKPVSKALHKVLEAVKVNAQDIPEMKASKAELAGYVNKTKSVKPDQQAIKGIDAVAMPVFNSAEMTVVASKADIVKKMAAKAPANISETYKGKSAVYDGEKQGYYWSDIYTMTTVSLEGDINYMIDIIPDQISGMGVPVLYTSVDKGDGTTAITIAPQWEMRNESHDIFVCDYTSLKNGGDGSIKMTLAADGNLTFDNPDNIVGYWATPIDETIENPIIQEPTLDPTKILGYYENCIRTTYTLPEPDAFVAEATYTGKGYDKDDGNLTWDMQMGTKDGALVIRNLVPSVESYTGVPTDVVYTQTGNTITIQPQSVGKASGYYLYMYNYKSADGVITLKKDDKGYLTTDEQLDVRIDALTADEFNKANIAGYWTWTEDVKFYADGQEIPNPAPNAMYEPAYTALYIGWSSNIYGYNNTLSFLPGYAEIPYVNTTKDEATSWAWEVCDSVVNMDTKAYEAGTNKVTGTEKNFSFTTQGSAVFGTPTLIASNGELASAPYVWGVNTEEEEDGTTPRYVYQYVGDYIDSYTDSEGGTFTVSVCNPGNEKAYYSSFATPGLNSKNNIASIYMYQGKPAAPLYITGLNLFVRNLEVESNFELTARIVEARRSSSGSLSFGKTIAYVDASADDIVITNTQSGNMAQINFNDMYVLDEDEMGVTIDHLFLDQEFAVVIDGWNNGTFQCYPYGEYNYNANGFTNTLFVTAEEPDKLYRFTNQFTHLALGFNGGAYGILHTADNADFTVLATGGEEKIHVDDAMLANEGETPRISVSDDCPDWVTVEAENVAEKGYAFDLKFTFAENDGAAREAKFYVYQEGAKIDVTVNQAAGANAGTGISGIAADGASANAPRYNVAGQRVNASAKGIVISNGRKQIAK